VINITGVIIAIVLGLAAVMGYFLAVRAFEDEEE
jgi:uncharacterized protein YneF (UPF0154 family)